MTDGGARYSASTMRASDADRDAVVTELGEHFQAGRLTSDELEERTGQALQARTFGDLARLTADLPSVQSAAPLASRPGNLATTPRRGWPSALTPVVLGLAAVVVVVGALIGAGTGGRGSHVWWLILVLPLVLRRMATRSRR